MQIVSSASVITKVVKHGRGPVAHPPVDRLVLDADQRASPHFSASTEAGIRVRVSLDRGSELDNHDILVADDGLAVEVVAADEDLVVVRPGNTIREWAAVCYQLGNLHRALKVADDEILTPRDAQVEAFLTKLGAHFRRERRPFIGERLGAAAGHHHHDGHGHHR